MQTKTTEVDEIKRTFAILSFDFAEQVHYPSNPQQVDPTYFKTARKCGIIGIHDERSRVQMKKSALEKKQTRLLICHMTICLKLP